MSDVTDFDMAELQDAIEDRFLLLGNSKISKVLPILCVENCNARTLRVILRVKTKPKLSCELWSISIGTQGYLLSFDARRRWKSFYGSQEKICA